MDDRNQAWFSEFGLNKDQFSSLPSGENPIIWAIQNNYLDSEQYLHWASEHYQLPRIDDSFFHFSMDSSLAHKHENLHPWNSQCYPIYEWEEILYIACLEPVSLKEGQKICFVIASPEAMESAWKKNYKSQIVSETKKEEQQVPPPPIPDLDFSNINPGPEKEEFSQVQPVEKVSSPPEINEAHESEALDGLSFADLNLANLEAEADHNEIFDDDITPPPTQTSQKDLDQHTQSMEQEVTETEHSAPAFIPKEKRITDEDLRKFTDLNHCQGTKDIISHIFYHLTKDYNKLMWVELSETGQFFPRFVYGPWSMESSSWNHAIDVSKPNIFRIAFKSSLPFHGEVSPNKANSNYLNWWNNKATPNHVTIYPLIFDEACFGFITCFDKGPEFDFVNSLKKIENLISLSNKAFATIHMKKAS